MFEKSKDSAIKLLNYAKYQGESEIISNMTFSFPKGRAGVLVGKCEQEKSMLLRSIGGHESFCTGDIVIGGKSAKNSGSEYKRNVFLVSPHIQFNLPCPLSHVPGILIAFYQNWDFLSYRTWLDYMRLPDDVSYSQLSAVNKMKALTAIALSSGAEVLLFEEVDSYLDADQQHSLLNTLEVKCALDTTALIGSKHLTRWIDYDLDFYTFKKSQLLRLDASRLRNKILGTELPLSRPASLSWKNADTAENTMTRNFLA